MSLYYSVELSVIVLQPPLAVNSESVALQETYIGQETIFVVVIFYFCKVYVHCTSYIVVVSLGEGGGGGSVCPRRFTVV